jgi:lipopolysaccharide heptosyltransferase I
MNILIVRLGALGDLVHTIPAAAAIRTAHPGARIDWLVEKKHSGIIDLVVGIDRIVTLDAPTPAGWIDVVRRLRQVRYDVALDFQGLMKSAVLARASGARRVVGFSIWHLREKSARPFYSEVHPGSPAEHVIHKNLRLLATLGIQTAGVEFPLRRLPSSALDEVARVQGGRPFALINPGAAWPNKRWPPERFGEVAAFLREVRGLSSVVLWGPGERPLAESIVGASAGAARLAPATTLVDLLELSRAASLMVSGDTGPLHIAAAVSTPIVALFGPTDPARNGPWSTGDTVVSRYAACGCHYQRRCHQRSWCLGDVPVAEVTAAIQQRFSGLPRS